MSGREVTPLRLHKMGILDLLFPPRCVSCGKVGKYICKKCFSKIDFIRHQICPICLKPSIDGVSHYKCGTKYTIDGMFALAHYQGPIRDAIHLIKYRSVYNLSRSLVDLLSDHLYLPCGLDLLTAVPLHHKRERERGFNQSYILAKHLGKKLNIPLSSNILTRIKNNKPQVKLKGEERRENVRGIFKVSDREEIVGKRVGLIDDVATTCSTLRECASNLKRSGVRLVWGIVLAHG